MPTKKYLLINYLCPGWLKPIKLVGAPSLELKGCGLDLWSGHMPRLWVWFQLGHIQEAAGQCFLLTSIFLSLPSPLSEINKHILR